LKNAGFAKAARGNAIFIGQQEIIICFVIPRASKTGHLHGKFKVDSGGIQMKKERLRSHGEAKPVDSSRGK
jgi:hypothetical protein